MKQSDLDYFNQAADQHPLDTASFDEELAPVIAPTVSVPTKQDTDFFQSIADKETPYLPNANAPVDTFGNGLGGKILSQIGAANERLAGGVEQYAGEAPQRLGGYAPSIGGNQTPMNQLSDMQKFEKTQADQDQQDAYNEYIAQKTGKKPSSLANLISATQASGAQDLATKTTNEGKGVGDLLDVTTSAPIAAIGALTSGGHPLDQAAELQKEANATSAANQYNVPAGSGTYYAAKTLEGLGTIAPALGISAITKNPEFLGGTLGLQGLGDEYATQRAAGATPSEAQGAAVPVGALNYAIGALPLGQAIESTSGIVSTMGKSAAEQVVINNLLNDAQMGIEQGTLRPDQTFSDYLQKVKDTTKDSTVLGAINGILFGGVGHLAGSGAREMSINAETNPVLTPEGGVAATPAYNAETGRMESPEDNVPQVPHANTEIPSAAEIAPVDIQGRIEPTFAPQLQLSPATDIDTAATTLNAIKSGDIQAAHPDVVNDLSKTGEITTGDAGQPTLTELGNKLLDAINDAKPQSEQPNMEHIAPEVKTSVNDQKLPPQELPKTVTPDVENRAGTVENAPEAAKETPSILESATPEEEKAIADYQNAKQMEIPFSVTPRSGDNGSLVVQHNLSADNLEHADKMGGIAVPSLAISKGEHPLHSFGEISLIGDKDLINPKTSAKNKVYGSDVYSPRYPQVEYRANYDDVKKTNDTLRPYLDKTGARDLDVSSIQDSGVKDLHNNSAIMASFLDSKGIEPKYVNENGKVDRSETTAQLRKQIDDSNLRQKFEDYAGNMYSSIGTGERIFNGYTPSGNRKYLPHNLDTVVKLLTKKVRGGENFNYGVGSIRAEYSKQFKTLKDIKAHEDRIVDSKTFDKIKEDVDGEFFKLADKWRDYSNNKNIFGFYDNFSEHLKEAATEGLPYVNKEYYDSKVPLELQKETAGFLNKLKDFNTEYFEAKLQRPVGIGEFKGAVVPEGAEWDKSIQTLQKNGVNRIERYTSGDEESRKQAIGKFSDTFFKANETSTTPTDRFLANKDQLKTQLDNIIRKINPSVKTEFSDKLFGEGEAIKASGGSSTEHQEVAGSYNRLENIIKVSLNTDKWDALDTAFHEAIHSVTDMLKPSDASVLKREFPGTDNLSQDEHQTIGIAKILTDKNATGFSAAVKRIASMIGQALRDIGRAFKLGKFNSINDIANRIERGSVYNDYQKALKVGDVESLKNSTLSPESQKQAIKDVSPALHDTVYKAMPDKDEEALNNINLENNGTPEEKAASIGNNVYDKTAQAINRGLDTLESAKEKMLRSTVDLVKPIIPEKVYENAKERIEHSIAMTKRNNDPLNIGRAVKDSYGVLVSSTDGFIRSIAAKFKSATALRVADIFHADPGRARSIGATYHENIADFYNKGMSQVANLLDKVKSTTDKEAIRNYMVHPELMTAETTKSGNGYIAAHLSKRIQDMRDHLAASGYDIPQVEGFYPRIYDTDFIVKNELNFKRDARLAYLDTYKDDYASMSPEEREGSLNDRVNSWFNNILLQDNGLTSDPNKYFRSVSTTPDAPSSFKSRTLSKAADDILANYMVRDPLEAMNKLTMQTARKAAWETHFGGNKLQEIHDGLVREGVDHIGIQHVMDVIRANTGQLGGNINPTIKTGLALARYWTAVNYLTKAPFKHLSIALNVGAQTGNMANAWRTFADGLHAFVGTSDKTRAMKTLGELSGIYGEAAEHSLMMNQAGMATDNAKVNWLSKQYFKAVGMTHLVGSFKLGMMRSIQYYLGNMADDIVNHSNSYKSSEFMIKNYGVPTEEVGNFAKWVMDGGGKNLQQSIMLDNSPYSKMYQLAQQRAVNQMISNPTPATRQMYATHPVGSVIMQMTAYHMAFIKNSLERNARMAGEGLNPSNGFSAKDRMRMLSPMAMTIPVMWGFAAAYNAAKNAAFPPDKEDKNNPAVASFLDSDFFGQFNGLLKDVAASQMAQKHFGYKYRTFDDNVLGADASLAGNYWKMMKNLPNNFSSNEKARSAQLKSEYNLLVAPITTAVLSKYNAFAIPTWAAIQAINHPSVRRFITGAKQP